MTVSPLPLECLLAARRGAWLPAVCLVDSRFPVDSGGTGREQAQGR